MADTVVGASGLPIVAHYSRQRKINYVVIALVPMVFLAMLAR
ncbi:hypothetical protein AF72_00185 [Xylella taiwanensis]|uniref:Uncharacterized protein n=1 Tax=Xylella taiwanensis TaxID=1444770 RepID=Z9JNT9_9GAMM|nr:hypothetical protein AF72_00185 [Xylella taiwanensis]